MYRFILIKQIARQENFQVLVGIFRKFTPMGVSQSIIRISAGSEILTKSSNLTGSRGNCRCLKCVFCVNNLKLNNERKKTWMKNVSEEVREGLSQANHNTNMIAQSWVGEPYEWTNLGHHV